MLPEEIKNEWKKQIEEDFPGTGESIKLLKIIILLKQETAYAQGESATLRESLNHYREMYSEDVCTCLHCLLERSEEDDDEDGMGRDGFPADPKEINPSKLGDDEKDRLEKMFGESTE